jgi:hypothetical protein
MKKSTFLVIFSTLYLGACVGNKENQNNPQPNPNLKGINYTLPNGSQLNIPVEQGSVVAGSDVTTDVTIYGGSSGYVVDINPSVNNTNKLLTTSNLLIVKKIDPNCKLISGSSTNNTCRIVVDAKQLTLYKDSLNYSITLPGIMTKDKLEPYNFNMGTGYVKVVSNISDDSVDFVESGYVLKNNSTQIVTLKLNKNFTANNIEAKINLQIDGANNVTLDKTYCILSNQNNQCDIIVTANQNSSGVYKLNGLVNGNNVANTLIQVESPSASLILSSNSINGDGRGFGSKPQITLTLLNSILINSLPVDISFITKDGATPEIKNSCTLNNVNNSCTIEFGCASINNQYIGLATGEVEFSIKGYEAIYPKVKAQYNITCKVF